MVSSGVAMLGVEAGSEVMYDSGAGVLAGIEVRGGSEWSVSSRHRNGFHCDFDLRPRNGVNSIIHFWLGCGFYEKSLGRFVLGSFLASVSLSNIFLLLLAWQKLSYLNLS